MSKPRDLISVIMPVYNCGQYVDVSIKSILAQTYSHFEYIVIDDASTDDTLKKVKKFSDRRIVIMQNNRRLEVTKSLNKGLSIAKGKYIARMDGDDIAKKNRFKVQTEYLKDHPSTVAVGSWAEIVNDQGNIVGVKKTPIKHSEIKKKIMQYNPFIHPTMMLKTDVLVKSGRYRQAYNGAEDYDLFLRLVPKYCLENIPKALMQFRFYSESDTAVDMKRIEFQSLRARVRALYTGNYPYWQSVYLIKPLVSYLIPTNFKKRFIYHQ